MATSAPLSILCRYCGNPAVEMHDLPFSQWPTLLGHHTVPTPAQAIEICDVISSLQSRVTEIDEDLTRIKLLQDQLLRKRDEALAAVTQHKLLIGPIRRLPAELLAEIFWFCLPLYDMRHTNFSFKAWHSSLSRRQAPLLLGRVCSLWRMVTLSTPSLWSSFGALYYDDKFDRTLTGAKTFLARSGTCPLYISLIDCSSTIGRTRELVNTVASYSHQWRTFAIFAKLETVNVLANNVKGALPLLDTLTLGLTEGQPLLEQPHAFRNAFEIAPSLRNIVVSNQLSPLQLKLPWSQLTHFCVDETLHLKDSLDVLRSCPNLVYLAISRNPTAQSVTDYPHILHPKLLELRIPAANLAGFFESLTLPALRHVRVVDDLVSEPYWDPLPFHCLLARSQCILDVASFEIRSADTLLLWLDTVPSITDLQITAPLNYISFVIILQRLTYDILRVKRLCPKLRAISFPKDCPLDPPALFAFLNSRRRGLNPRVALLNRISQVCSSMPERALLVGLKHFQNEGLQISFTDPQGVGWLSRMEES